MKPKYLALCIGIVLGIACSLSAVTGNEYPKREEHRAYLEFAADPARLVTTNDITTTSSNINFYSSGDEVNERLQILEARVEALERFRQRCEAK